MQFPGYARNTLIDLKSSLLMKVIATYLLIVENHTFFEVFNHVGNRLNGNSSALIGYS